eukprot:1161765-Pelagomonas_calceolata.AAC.6
MPSLKKAEWFASYIRGIACRWDMVEHTCVARRAFTFKHPGEGANTLCYSRDGSLLVAGLDAGYIYIMNTADLTDVHAARNTTAAILKMSMCVTGGVLAVADSNHQVLLYAYLPYKHIKRWEYVGECVCAPVGKCMPGPVGECMRGPVGKCMRGPVGKCMCGSVGECMCGPVGESMCGPVFALHEHIKLCQQAHEAIGACAHMSVWLGMF